MIKATFSIGFRPFFILCALMALINPFLWILNYANYLEIESVFSSAMAWHGHEMLFGFAAALTCGFLLTASSNWTGRPPIKGAKLMLLAALFVLERFIPFFGMSKLVSLIFMSLYSFLFMGYLIYMLWGNRNQFAVTPIMLIFYLSKLAFLIGDFFEQDSFYEYGRDYAVLSFILLIVVISGRVIPMFSQRHLGYRLEVPPMVNKLSMLSIVLLFIPSEFLPIFIQAALLIFAIVTNAIRLHYWKPLECYKFPMINVLHMGIVFLILGLILTFMQLFDEAYNVTMVPMHGMTLGALGVFAIGMMVRVTKGHTGRDLAPATVDRLIFHGIYISALSRMLPIVTDGEYLVEILLTATTFWFLSYFLYLVFYANALLTPRPDAQS